MVLIKIYLNISLIIFAKSDKSLVEMFQFTQIKIDQKQLLSLNSFKSHINYSAKYICKY